MPDEPDFDWPAGYEPERAAIRARRSIYARAPAGVVWEQLVSASAWSQWFPFSKNVALPTGETALRKGIRFKWTMQGIRFESEVREFVPSSRLSWCSRNPLISTYHVWHIDEADGRALIVTDETQRGLLPVVLGFVVKPKLMNGQRVWLEELARRAEASASQSGLA